MSNVIDRDVVVVGAGPAGTTVGGILALRGWRVLVLDRARFPRPNPCGECINPGAVALLDRLGLLESVRALNPVPLRGWRVRTPTSRTAVGTFRDDRPAGLALSRSRLDHALLRAAVRRGAEVREGRRVEHVSLSETTSSGIVRSVPRVRFCEPDGTTRTARARVVVGADGLRSVTARRLGVHHRRPRVKKVSVTGRVAGRGPARDRGHLVLADRMVLGLAPVESGDDLWNATVVVDSERFAHRLAGDALPFLRESLATIGPAWDRGPDLLGGPWASGPFDWPVRRPGGFGYVLVGDAAGYYDPLTGQGMYRALRSAELAGEAIDRKLSELDREAEGRARTPRGEEGRLSYEAGTERRGPRIPRFDDYGRSLRREFRPGRWIQRLVEAIVSRRPLREAAVNRLARAPRAMSALIRVTGDQASPRSLLRPVVWATLAWPGRPPSRRTRAGSVELLEHPTDDW